MSVTCATHASCASLVGFDACEPVVAQVRLKQSAIQSTCCSIEMTMLLSTDGLPGPVIVNRFGKPADHEPEVGARAVGPRVAERQAVAAPDVDAEQRAGHRVEAGGEHDGVELVLARRSCGCRDVVISTIGVFFRSTRVHVRPVVGLEVVGVDAQPLAADGLVLRGERLGDLGVVHDLRGSCRGRTRRRASFASSLKSEVACSCRGTRTRPSPIGPRTRAAPLVRRHLEGGLGVRARCCCRSRTAVRRSRNSAKCVSLHASRSWSIGPLLRGDREVRACVGTRSGERPARRSWGSTGSPTNRCR